MTALIVKGMVTGASTLAVLAFIALLPYVLLGYTLYHAGKMAVKQLIPGLTSRHFEDAPAGNTSTLLHGKWAA